MDPEAGGAAVAQLHADSVIDLCGVRAVHGPGCQMSQVTSSARVLVGGGRGQQLVCFPLQESNTLNLQSRLLVRASKRMTCSVPCTDAPTLWVAPRAGRFSHLSSISAIGEGARRNTDALHRLVGSCQKLLSHASLSRFARPRQAELNAHRPC